MNLLRIFLFLSAFVTSERLLSNHVLGGSLSWECLGGNQYGITFQLYKDCFGSTPPPVDETVFFFPSGCASIPFSVDLDLQSVAEISDLCPTELVNSSCNGGFIPGTQLLTYYEIVTLNPSCVWNLQWSGGDWNYFVNIDTGSLPNAFFKATIDPSMGCESSVSVSSLGVPYFCQGDLVNWQISVDNPSGYTLDYSLTNVLTTGGVSAPYEAGYSGAVPIPGIAISATGEITFTAPLQFGSYSVGIQIDMYDALGNLVGSYYESMAFIVRICLITTTDFTAPGIIAADPTVELVSGTEINVCAGETFCFSVEATNSNNIRNITMSTDFTGIFPSGTFTQTGTNPAVGEFCLTTDASMIGTYVIEVEATDDACILPGYDQLFITLTIQPNIVVSAANALICIGDSYAVTATGANQYNWNVVSGDSDPEFSCVSCGNQTLTPEQNTIIEIIGVGAPLICNYRDTLSIIVSLSDIDVSITDETCAQNDGAIDVTVNAGSGFYSYTWNVAPANSQDQTGLDSGNYSVTISDLNIPGCQVDSTVVVDTTPAPSGSISGNITICEGESADILFDLTGVGPFNLTMTPLGSFVASDGDILQLTPATTTVYTLTSIQDANIPPCTYIVPSSVTVTVRPIVEATFLAVNPICEGDQTTLEFDINEPGVYNVQYTPGGTANGIADGATINVSPITDTDYTITSVEHTTAPLCASVLSNTVNLVVNDLPSAILSGGDEICVGENIDLQIDLTGTGPWVVSYSINSVAQVDLNVAASPFVLNVSPLATAEYCLTSVTDQGVNCAQNISSCQQVIVEPVPSATFTGDITICDGSSTNLIIDLIGAAGLYNVQMNITDSQGSSSITLSNLSDPYLYNISPLENTTYEVVSIEYANNPGDCVTNINQSVDVFINPPLSVVVTDTVCTPNAQNYQVLFEFTGGDPTTYNAVAVGAGAGVFNGSIYTSGFVSSSAGASWTFSDQYNCSPINIVMAPYNCPVVTYSGTMSADTLVICGNDIAATTYNNDGIFDFDDQLMFILHDSPTSTIGTIFATDCNDSDFNDADNPLIFGYSPGAGIIVYGQVYYVSAVVGDDDGSGDCVDTSAPFVSFSEGQPIVFYEIPSATLSGGGSVCVGGTVDIQFDLTGTPPWDIVFAIDGLDQPAIDINSSPFVLAVDVSGTYSLTSVMTNGCGGSTAGSQIVVINPLPTATFDGDGITCELVPYEFEITLTGTAPWNFTVQNTSAGVVTNDPITVLVSPYLYLANDSGSYVLTGITDDNGCLGIDNSAEVTLTVNDTPSADFTFADTSFCEGANLDLIVELTGSPPWTAEYAIDGIIQPDWNILSSPFTTNINTPGNYVITQVEDANGCIENLALNEVTILEIALPIMSAGPDVLACSGEDVILGTPLNPLYTYTWNTSVGLNDSTLAQPTFNVINTGVDPSILLYTLTAFNQQCSLSDDISATIQPIPTIDAGANDSLCFGASTNLNATGGTSYLWTDNGFFNSLLDSANPSVSPSYDVWFYVIGYDDFFCEASDSVFILVADELTITETFNPNVCYGTCIGSIELLAEGGFEPYEIDWTNSTQIGFAIDSLCPGIYDYSITDSFGCDTVGSIELIELNESFIDDVNIIPSSCFGANTGQIQVIDALGVDYTLIDVSLTNTTGIFDDLNAGEYSIEMTDTDGCISDTVVSFVASSLEITMSTTFSNLLVCYNDLVTFEANANGGNGSGFTYNWYNCEEALPGCLVSTGNPVDFLISQDTALYVVATDGLGCTSDTLAMSTYFNTAILVGAGPSDTVYVCDGLCVELTAGAGGGTGAIDIVWTADDGNGPVEIAETYNTTECPIVNTLYVAVGTDGCTPPGYDSVYVMVYETPEAIIDVNVYDGCYPTTIEFFNLTDPDMIGNCEYDLGDGNVLAVCSDFEYTYAFPGEYFPTLTVVSPDGCSDTDTVDFSISIHGYPEASFTWEPLPVNTLESEVQFFDLSLDAVSWDWNFGGMGVAGLPDPMFNFPPEDLQSFIVCLKVENEFGCEDSICIDLFIESVLLVYVPNAFTPDGDGTNDYFFPVVKGIDPNEYRFVIYDRWGNRVFTSTTPNEVWEGGYDGSDYFVQNDIYIWRLEVKELSTGEEKIYKGHVSLLR
jgi:gliding motility-associated-like protein